LKILEFNTVAEEVFGKKHDHVINKNYFDLFVPEPERHKTEQQMNQLLKQAGENKIKMRAIGADGVEMEMEWTIHVLSNNQKLPMGVIIISKK
jgi:PAS domain S-box-containing protein